MNFNDYADWFVECIKCDICKEFVLGKGEGFVCNDNIEKRKIEQDEYPIRPQAGCIDKERWFKDQDDTIRILLLGMNPRGGYGDNARNKNKDKDTGLYEIYDEILKSSNRRNMISEKICKLEERVGDYKPTSIECEIQKIFKEEKNKDVVFAYANQILCRTKPEAGKLSKISTFKDVYRNCFTNHIKSLIAQINPHFIIAMGITWEKQFEEQFNNLASNYPKHSFVAIHHPGYPKNKSLALKRLREFVKT
jgi:hypothetical protein